MSGEKKLQTYKEKMDEFITILNEYTDKIGLTSIQYNSEVQEIFLFTTDSYKGLNAEDSFAYSLTLKGYSIYLNKEYNRHKNIKIWAEKHLNYVISAHWHDYATGNYDNYEVIKNQIIRDSEPASLLTKIIEKAESRVLELDGIATKVSMYAQVFKSMAETKRWSNR